MKRVRNYIAIILAFILTICCSLQGEAEQVFAASITETSAAASVSNELFDIAISDGNRFAELPVNDVDIDNPDKQSFAMTVEEYLELHDDKEISVHGYGTMPLSLYDELPELSFNSSGGLSLSKGGYDAGADAQSGFGLSTMTQSQLYLYRVLTEEMEKYVSGSDFANRNYSAADDTHTIIVYREEGTDFNVTGNEAYWVGLTFFYNNPQYFFAKASFATALLSNGVIFKMRIRPEFYSAKVRTETAETILSTAKAVVDQIQANLSVNGSDENKAYMKAVLAHDWVVNEIDYKYDNAGQPDDTGWAHTLAGVFTDYGAVCEGYAKAYHYLLNLLGVPCLYVVGWSGTGGAGGGGLHAWNYVKIGNAFFAVDTTWDDLSPKRNSDLPWYYTYFCLRRTEFIKRHTAFTTTDYKRYNEAYWEYTLPTLSDDPNYRYYERNGYIIGAVDDADTIEKILYKAVSEQGGFWAQIMVHKSAISGLSSVVSCNPSLPKFPSGGYVVGDYYVSFTPNSYISTPAETLNLSIDGGKTEVSVGDLAYITADITPKNSGDRVLWTVECSENMPGWVNAKDIANIVKGERNLSLKGIHNGELVVTAQTLAGKQKASIEIKFTGGAEGDFKYQTLVIYQNGGTSGKGEEKVSYKSVTVVPEKVEATDWSYISNGKQKTGKGKLVYVVTRDQVAVAYDAKHKVVTKSNKEIVSVNSKGVVTAKKAGEAYVHICDTGSMKEEVVKITVLAAPSKVTLSSISNPSDKKDYITKKTIEVGETQTVYVIPYVKDGTASKECLYTVEYAKDEYAQYLSFEQPTVSSNGLVSFNIIGTSADNDKRKPASVKLVIKSRESGKKSTLSVMVANSVTIVAAAFHEEAGQSLNKKLEKKGDIVNLDLALYTNDGVNATTDKVKVYVGKSSVSLDTKGKVTADKGATVKATLSKDMSSVSLKASKDAAVPAVIAVVTTTADKTNHISIIATISGDGTVKLLQ